MKKLIDPNDDLAKPETFTCYNCEGNPKHKWSCVFSGKVTKAQAGEE